MQCLYVPSAHSSSPAHSEPLLLEAMLDVLPLVCGEANHPFQTTIRLAIGSRFLLLSFSPPHSCSLRVLKLFANLAHCVQPNPRVWGSAPSFAMLVCTLTLLTSCPYAWNWPRFLPNLLVQRLHDLRFATLEHVHGPRRLLMPLAHTQRKSFTALLATPTSELVRQDRCGLNWSFRDRLSGRFQWLQLATVSLRDVGLRIS